MRPESLSALQNTCINVSINQEMVYIFDNFYLLVSLHPSLCVYHANNNWKVFWTIMFVQIIVKLAIQGISNMGFQCIS